MIIIYDSDKSMEAAEKVLAEGYTLPAAIADDVISEICPYFEAELETEIINAIDRLLNYAAVTVTRSDGEEFDDDIIGVAESGMYGKCQVVDDRKKMIFENVDKTHSALLSGYVPNLTCATRSWIIDDDGELILGADGDRQQVRYIVRLATAPDEKIGIFGK